MKARFVRMFVLVTCGAALIALFVNCESKHELTENNLASTQGICEDELKATYSKTIYPFLTQESTCRKCHRPNEQEDAPTFAADDLEMSYHTFESYGLDTIGEMATNPSHRPPNTGEINRPAIENLKVVWSQAVAQFNQCNQKASDNIPQPEPDNLHTAEKGFPASIFSGTTTATLSWDLGKASDVGRDFQMRNIPISFTIQVKRLVDPAGKHTGYTFSNPTVQLRDTSIPYTVDAVFVYINGNLAADLDAFNYVSTMLSTTQAVVLRSASADAKLENPSNTDVISIEFRRVIPINFGSTDLSLALSDATTSSTSFLRTTLSNVKITGDGNAIRWCLTTSDVKPTTSTDPCPGAAAGAANGGWLASRPTQFTFPAGDGAKILYLWVVDQNLQVNSLSASDTITLDSARPPAPVISGLQANAPIQVATFTTAAAPAGSGITGYCVYESATNVAPAMTLMDPCWSWSPGPAVPTTVGYKGTGNRFVFVFARDEAGNISPASNVLTGNNTLAPITFAQLNSNTANVNVFTSSCNGCHNNPNNFGFTLLPLLSYAQTLASAQSGKLLERINDASNPMPSSGLMSKSRRDLVRLWILNPLQ